MAPMMRRATDLAHPMSLETVRPVMAKADLKNLEMPRWNEQIGRALVLARGMLGWTQKEAAARVNVDQATYARWEAGDERHRPQFDRIFAVEELREPVAICIARIAGMDVGYQIRSRRLA